MRYQGTYQTPSVIAKERGKCEHIHGSYKIVAALRTRVRSKNGLAAVDFRVAATILS